MSNRNQPEEPYKYLFETPVERTQSGDQINLPPEPGDSFGPRQIPLYGAMQDPSTAIQQHLAYDTPQQPSYGNYGVPPYNAHNVPAPAPTPVLPPFAGPEACTRKRGKVGLGILPPVNSSVSAGPTPAPYNQYTPGVVVSDHTTPHPWDPFDPLPRHLSSFASHWYSLLDPSEDAQQRRDPPMPDRDDAHEQRQEDLNDDDNNDDSDNDGDNDAGYDGSSRRREYDRPLKRSHADMSKKDRSPSPSSNDAGPRKRMRSSDPFMIRSVLSTLSTTAGLQASRSTTQPGYSCSNPSLPPGADKAKARTGGLALPPPSAAIGYKTSEYREEPGSGLALPPMSAATRHNQNQTPFIPLNQYERRPGSLTDPGFDHTLPSWDIFKVVPDSVGYLHRVWYGSNPKPASEVTDKISRRCDRCHLHHQPCGNYTLRCARYKRDGAQCTSDRPLYDSRARCCIRCQELAADEDICDGKSPCDRCYDDDISPCSYELPILDDTCDRCYRNNFTCVDRAPNCRMCTTVNRKCEYKIRGRRQREIDPDPPKAKAPKMRNRRCRR